MISGVKTAVAGFCPRANAFPSAGFWRCAGSGAAIDPLVSFGTWPSWLVRGQMGDNVAGGQAQM